MPSRLAWLDTSERERRKALDVIDLFQQRDTRDELGIAGVRDALSDLLSPGTSTIQTRTRYFFFLPWMYQEFEGRRSPTTSANKAVRKYETDLIEVLVASADPSGTIGIEARAAVKRLPSDVYWAGLGTLGIRLFRGHAGRYHHALERRSISRVDEMVGSDVRTDEPIPGNWHPHIPPAPSDFPRTADFALRHHEADYLLDRLRTHAGGSLLAYLADARSPDEDALFPWNHSLVSRAPAALREIVEHARCFSETMRGAALLYNLLLAEALAHREWIDLYRSEFGEWSNDIGERDADLRAWDQRRFWEICRRQNSRIPTAAQIFSSDWIALCLGKDPAQLADDPHAREFIVTREQRLKGERSRLTNRSYLEQWNGASGARPLIYRWGMTQTIVREIHEALAR